MIVFFLIILIITAFFLLTKKKISFNKNFDTSDIGNNIEEYINNSESKYYNIFPWTKKRIIWDDPKSKVKSKVAIIYIHGFSASLGEIRPVPDVLAKNYSANLFYTRLSGHGIKNNSNLKNVDCSNWYLDIQEAFEIGKRIGNQIIVVATSFGCTLVTEYLSKNKIDNLILANVFISPCFGIPDWRMKFARYTWSNLLFRILIGEKRVTKHRKSEEKKWWSNEIPIEFIINLELSVEKIWLSDFGNIKTPSLFLFCPKDRWISIKRIKKATKRWGGDVSLVSIDVSNSVDNKNYHVILGDIKAASETELGIDIIMNWLNNTVNSIQNKH